MKCRVKLEGIEAKVYPVDFTGGKYFVITNNFGAIIYSVTDFERIYEIVED